MSPDDLQDMSRCLDQERLLFVAGFEPVPWDGCELFERKTAEGHLKLYTRGRALVVALEELTALDRGHRSHADNLTMYSVNDEREEQHD